MISEEVCMDAINKRTVLLVEDEAIVCISESKKLQDFGYTVVIAHSGKEAVELAQANSDIQLVLMDINLGEGIDGTEAAKQILSHRDIPIVFLTSHSEKEMVDKVKGITRYGYIIKNSGDFVLQSSIDMAFELFSLMQQYKKKTKS
jgi:CheY-like chemotaxis protein